MLKRTLLILVLASFISAAVNAEVVERVLAVVNDRAITMTDLDEETAILTQLGVSVDRSELLDALITRLIVNAEAGRLGLTITMDEVTREIVRFEETFPSRSEFNIFLKNHELNVKDLSRRFASSIAVERVREQKSGVSEGRYEKWLAEARKKADIKIFNE